MNIKILAVAALLVSASAVHAAQAPKAPAAPSAATQTYKTKELHRAQIDALLAKPDELVIIDIRRPDELSKIGGFPAYLSIQLDDLEKYAAFIPKQRKVVTVSNHAHRAFKAGDLLSAKGYNVVGAIGVQNYEQEGGTLSKIAVPPPRTAAAAPAVKAN